MIAKYNNLTTFNHEDMIYCYEKDDHTYIVYADVYTNSDKENTYIVKINIINTGMKAMDKFKEFFNTSKITC